MILKEDCPDSYKIKIALTKNSATRLDSFLIVGEGNVFCANNEHWNAVEYRHLCSCNRMFFGTIIIVIYTNSIK